MQYSNQQSKSIIFNPPISLNKLKFRFTNSNDKDYNFYNLDFSFQVVIKFIDNNTFSFFNNLIN